MLLFLDVFADTFFYQCNCITILVQLTFVVELLEEHNNYNMEQKLKVCFQIYEYESC